MRLQKIVQCECSLRDLLEHDVINEIPRSYEAKRPVATKDAFLSNSAFFMQQTLKETNL